MSTAVIREQDDHEENQSFVRDPSYIKVVSDFSDRFIQYDYHSEKTLVFVRDPSYINVVSVFSERSLQYDDHSEKTQAFAREPSYRNNSGKKTSNDLWYASQQIDLSDFDLPERALRRYLIDMPNQYAFQLFDNQVTRDVLECPHCESTNIKSCDYYFRKSTRYFCNNCRRNWWGGGVPFGNNYGSTISYNNSSFSSPLIEEDILRYASIDRDHVTPNDITMNYASTVSATLLFGTSTERINSQLREEASIVEELRIWINEDNVTDFDLPAKFVIANSSKDFTTKLMEIVLGITGQAAISLLAYPSAFSSSTASIPGLLYFVVAANAVGFIGTFAAMWFKNKKQVAAASVSGKIGATAAACAVTAAMGMFLPSSAIWLVGFVCLLTAVAVAFS